MRGLFALSIRLLWLFFQSIKAQENGSTVL